MLHETCGCVDSCVQAMPEDCILHAACVVCGNYEVPITEGFQAEIKAVWLYYYNKHPVKSTGWAWPAWLVPNMFNYTTQGMYGPHTRTPTLFWACSVIFTSVLLTFDRDCVSKPFNSYMHR